jgi:predicted  nucleic acid-binding Zn ribbon protein
LPRHVIQINFAFDKPMQSKTEYAGDCEDCADDFISSLIKNGKVIGDGTSFWSKPDVYSWIGSSVLLDILAPESLSAWSKSSLAQLNELDCKVSIQKLDVDFSEDTKPVTKPEYLVLFARTSDSPISDQDGCPYDPFSITLSDSQREDIHAWTGHYNAVDTIWLGLHELEIEAYKQLAAVHSELSREGTAICKAIELASGIPTYYYLLRYSESSQKESEPKCPQCGEDWCISEKYLPGFWNFEYRCDTCRLVSSQGDDDEDKNQPDASDRGYWYVMEGADMSPEQTLEMEERVARDSNDLRARLSLIGYYHHVPMARRTTTKALPHIMWLVENHPDAFTCRSLGLGLPYTEEQNLEFERLWLEQIRLHPNDDKIVGNAGSNIRSTNEKLGWHYIRQAALLNPKEEYWARKIAHHFAYLAINGDIAKRPHYAAIAIREAERFFNLQGTRGERFSVCHDVTPVAIEYGYLNEARTWNNWVLDHMSYSPFNQFGQFAWLLLAHIELADGKPIKCKILLRKALHSIQTGMATSTPSSSVMVALLDKLLVSGHSEIVIEALQVCIEKVSKEKKEQLKKWLKLIKQGKSPKLEWPKHQ